MPRYFQTCVVVSICGLILTGCTSPQTGVIPIQSGSKVEASTSPTSTNSASGDQKAKLCGPINNFDMIIELEFAEGVVKDTSYETGFYYSPIISNMKLARSICDYRIGFNYEELKGRGVVQIGVRGYSDNNRRQLANEPINVTFDADGKPNIEFPIIVKVLN